MISNVINTSKENATYSLLDVLIMTAWYWAHGYVTYFLLIIDH